MFILMIVIEILILKVTSMSLTSTPLLWQNKQKQDSPRRSDVTGDAIFCNYL